MCRFYSSKIAEVEKHLAQMGPLVHQLCFLADGYERILMQHAVCEKLVRTENQASGHVGIQCSFEFYCISATDEKHLT
jgi:hypothetical protein